MARYYPGISRSEIPRLTPTQLGGYLQHIPEWEYRNHASVAMLSYMVSSALGGKDREPMKFLPEFAKPARMTKPFSILNSQHEEELRLGLRMALISQDAFDYLHLNAQTNAKPLSA